MGYIFLPLAVALVAWSALGEPQLQMLLRKLVEMLGRYVLGESHEGFAAKICRLYFL